MLSVTCGDVVLRPATEQDDDALVAILPDDFEHDPTFSARPGEPLPERRARWLRHWLAELRRPAGTTDRSIPFVVEVDGRVVGLQTLEGDQFTRRRIVDSSSFLVPAMRGRRLGVAMRTAMLAVAFDRMGAVAAVSSARPENVASRRVSRAIGYRSTGRTEEVVAGSPRPLEHVEITREEWNRLDHLPVLVEGDLPWEEHRSRLHELAERIAGRPVGEPIWWNDAGALTFDLGDHHYLKVGPTDGGFDPAHDAERTAWAGTWMPVPVYLDHGVRDGLAWASTRGVPGTDAIDDRWHASPTTVVRACGRALRAAHDRWPVQDCPFTWPVEDRLARLSEDQRAELGPPPPIDPVVCHGDACLPNVILDADGRWAGLVDLGNLGVGDRWADIVDALHSVDRNYGERHRAAFLDGYGLAIDEARLSWYERLWQTGH